MFELDLGRDGPHALVAGTTGAGKSELLQSVVAGLAVHASPQDLQFVLIDYKGGAAFADCARLPHTAGLVTDLDSHLTERALRSLEAELKRRETLLARVGAADLKAYQRGALHQTDPLGRLVLVVDEFAALAEELPDFVAGLVGIAQRGRSLGVHLILATQRPAGAVSPEIRANMGLRIALRVTDAAESSDVLECDDAAQIDRATPGRAIIVTGNTLHTLQVGRIAAPIEPETTEVNVVALNRWGEAAARSRATHDDAPTDLQLLVTALQHAALATGQRPPRRPWLEPLPAVIDLSEPGHAHAAGGVDARDTDQVVIGVRDVPAEQAQIPITLNLSTGSTMLLAGGARTGRTNALRTIAGLAADLVGVDRLHLYAIDCAGGGLRVLDALPHCATVVGRDSPASIARLLTWLTDEVRYRADKLAELTVGTMAEGRALGVPMPTVLLLLDGWEGFVAAAEEADAGQAVETLLALLRDGSSVGVITIISGDRGALATRLCSAVQQRLVLRLADPADYAMVGITHASVPTTMPPGRAIDARDGAELQLGVLGGDPGNPAQAAALAAVIQRSLERERRAPSTVQPFALRPLPPRVTRAELGTPRRAGAVLLGRGGDGASPIEVDLIGTHASGDARFLVCGPPRSGRSCVLIAIAVQVHQTEGVDLVLACGTRSGLRRWSDGLGLPAISPDDSGLATAESLLEALLTIGRPAVLVMDDSEQFLDSRPGDWLTELVRVSPPGLAVVVAGRGEDLAMAFRGIGAEVKRARTGLLLQPGPGDGDALGIHLPLRRPSWPAGRGLLVARRRFARNRPSPELTWVSVRRRRAWTR